MPLDSDLITFDQNSLPAGFAGFGLVKVARNFRTKPGRNQIRPFTGRRFVLLDDPTKINVGGERNAAAQAATIDLTGFSVNSGVRGILTRGIDGSQLSCPNAVIPAGKTLNFAWMFDTLEDEWQWNDFACFEARPTTGTSGIPLTLLCDVERFQSQGYRKLEWKIFSFHFQQDFDGHLIWTVANGQSFDDPTNTTINEDAWLHPSCLAIDSVSISG
jgi:hypothetical protein